DRTLHAVAGARDASKARGSGRLSVGGADRMTRLLLAAFCAASPSALDRVAALPPNGLSVLALSSNKDSRFLFTSASDGVLFDIDGSGVKKRVAWPADGSEIELRSIDRDGDGRITNGEELISNRNVPAASNCFEALRELALQSNGGVLRGSVSSDDPLFTQLRLWFDRNHNGVSEPTE